MMKIKRLRKRKKARKESQDWEIMPIEPRVFLEECMEAARKVPIFFKKNLWDKNTSTSMAKRPNAKEFTISTQAKITKQATVKLSVRASTSKLTEDPY